MSPTLMLIINLSRLKKLRLQQYSQWIGLSGNYQETTELDDTDLIRRLDKENIQSQSEA